MNGSSLITPDRVATVLCGVIAILSTLVARENAARIKLLETEHETCKTRVRELEAFLRRAFPSAWALREKAEEGK